MEYYTNNVMPRAIYTKDHNAIAERLKKARLDAGLGQVEVAKKLGLPFLADAYAKMGFGKLVYSRTKYGDKPAFSISVNHRGTYTGITDNDRSLSAKEFGKIASGKGGKKEFEEKRVLLQELVEKTSYLITKNRTILEQAREKEEKMGQLDVCPTCLQKVSAEHKHLILDEEGKKAAQAEHLLAEMESQKKQIMQQREETEKNFLEILHKENGITRIEFELEHLQKKQQEMEEKKEKLRSLVQENNVIMKEVERVEKEKVLEEMEEELRQFHEAAGRKK